MTTEPMQDAAEQARHDNARNGQGDAPAQDPGALESELAAARAELAQVREDALRERAELDNQRKRLARDIEMARRFANERVLADLLPVIDSLEAGLKAAGADTGALREGMELTLRQLMKVASDHGLTPVDPLGQPFNPEHHQAMSMVEDASQPAGHVVQVYQKGWLLNERLLRPALVVVSREKDG